MSAPGHAAFVLLGQVIAGDASRRHAETVLRRSRRTCLARRPAGAAESAPGTRGTRPGGRPGHGQAQAPGASGRPSRGLGSGHRWAWLQYREGRPRRGRRGHAGRPPRRRPLAEFPPRPGHAEFVLRPIGAGGVLAATSTSRMLVVHLQEHPRCLRTPHGSPSPASCSPRS